MALAAEIARGATRTTAGYWQREHPAHSDRIWPSLHVSGCTVAYSGLLLLASYTSRRSQYKVGSFLPLKHSHPTSTHWRSGRTSNARTSTPATANGQSMLIAAAQILALQGFDITSDQEKKLPGGHAGCVVRSSGIPHSLSLAFSWQMLPALVLIVPPVLPSALESALFRCTLQMTRSVLPIGRSIHQRLV